MLGELGLQWTSHPVNLIRHDNHTPWFLGINPRGVVPVLVHDGVVHVESNDILHYLDATFARPGSSYFFEEGSTECLEAQRLLALEDSLHAELRLLTIRFGPLSVKQEKHITAQEQNGSFDKRRDHEVRWWRDKLENGIDEVEVRRALGRFRAVCSELDERLQSRRWLMGDKLCIVDIAWYVNLQRLTRLGYPMSDHEALHAFFESLSARPAFRSDAAHIGSRVSNTLFRLNQLGNRLRGIDLARLL